LSSTEGALKIERGDSGRISGNQWSRFYDEKIFKVVKDVLIKHPAPNPQ